MKRVSDMPRGIALAIPIATNRGHVMVFVPSVTNLGEFMIAGNGWFVIVRIRLARKILASVDEIEAEFHDAITGLGLVPRSGPVSCELWLYSRYGNLRHFRVGDAGLVEINCYGIPLSEVKPVPDPEPAEGQSPALPGPVVPAPVDSRTRILRYLAKRNADLKSGSKNREDNPAVPGNRETETSEQPASRSDPSLTPGVSGDKP
jgi:hypothetical protein